MPKRRDEHAPYWQQLRVAEKGIIEYALEHGKTIRGTAVILGISPNYLGERLRLLGIPVPDVRPGPKPGTKRPQAPKLRVVDAPPEETLDEDEEVADEDATPEAEDDAESDVLEDEEEEAEEDSDDAEGDPWDDADEDEDEDDGDDEGEDANAQGN